jgi:hypothetical protein
MRKRLAIAAAAATLTSPALGSAFQPQAVTQGGTVRQPTVEASPAPIDQKAALTALLRARVTLAMLNERSMSQDGRSALAPLADNFAQLFRTYSGHDMSTPGAGTPHSLPPAPDRVVDPDGVKRAYTAVDTTIARFIGPPSGDGAVGTSGRTIEGTPASTLEALRQLRGDLQLFYRAAMGEEPPSPGTAAPSR